MLKDILVKRKLEYKWIVAILAFLMIFTVIGFGASSRSIYIAAITEALDISRSTYSLVDTIRLITSTIVNIFFGALVAKFGVKKLVGTGFAFLISAVLTYSVAQSIWVFYIGGFLFGLGYSWTSTAMVGVIIGRFFKEQKGTVMGFVLSANGVGAALAMQIVSPIIYDETTKFGYRNAYRLVAVILFIVAVLVLVFLKELPQTASTQVHKKKARGNTWVGIPFSAVVKKTYFYLTIFAVFVSGIILSGTGGVAAPLLRDVGLPDGYVATVLSIHAVALTVFKVFLGFLYDKKGLRKTANTCYITAIIVMFMLTCITNSTLGLILAMVYGIFSSLSTPLETIMIPIFALDLFGERSFEKALGVITSANTAGMALGAPIYNLCYDVYGNYNLAIYIACGLMFVATCAMQYIISAAKKEREALI